MGKRSVNNSALHMIVTALCFKNENAKASDLVMNHYKNSTNMTDKLQALTDATHFDLACKRTIHADFEKHYSNNALAFDNFFRANATVESYKAIETVKELMKHPSYDGNNPNRVRALVGALALSNPVALNDISGDGYRLLCSEVKRLNSINASVAARILTPLLSFSRFDPQRQSMIRQELKNLMAMPNLSKSIYEKVEAALKER